MNELEFFSRKKIKKFIPKEYHFHNTFPYYIPLFGNMFWRRIKFISKLIYQIQIILKKKIYKVLDVGCEISFFSFNYGKNNPMVEIKGIDILTEKQNIFINRLYKKYSINFEIINHDIQKKSIYYDETFDLIVAFDVLEHLHDLNSALLEIKRLLKNNGLLIISIPVESKILKFFRLIYFKTIKKTPVTTRHYTKGGVVTSFKEYEELIKDNFNIHLICRYPFRSFPLELAYNCFYVLTK
ncbi:hypothetical protein LCGC14_0965270 [marine sediment metagenome]|uniref:Methyltransferase domain-containing protein n=1 Tax=marine sediment metagenome TaxID=412755 RepID=A0A0F9NZF2_9ZZZZ